MGGRHSDQAFPPGYGEEGSYLSRLERHQRLVSGRHCHPQESYPAPPPQGYLAPPPQGYLSYPPQGVLTRPPESYPVYPPESYPTRPPDNYPVHPQQSYPTRPPDNYPVHPQQNYPTPPPDNYPTDLGIVTEARNPLAVPRPNPLADTHLDPLADAHPNPLAVPRPNPLTDTHPNPLARSRPAASRPPESRRVPARTDEPEEEESLWGPPNWGHESDEFPAALLQETGEHLGLGHDLTGIDLAPEDTLPELAEDDRYPAQGTTLLPRQSTQDDPQPDHHEARSWHAGISDAIRQWRGSASQGPSIDDAEQQGDPGEVGRFSLSQLSPRALVLAAAMLMGLGMMAHWVNAGGDTSDSPPAATSGMQDPPSGPIAPVRPPASGRGEVSGQHQPGGRSDTGADVAPGADGAPGPGEPQATETVSAEGTLYRHVVVTPQSACHQFEETRQSFPTLTISVQNSCQ